MAPLPELLAPAGCWASLRAAVANGADAVYFGVDRFNARLRAENFRLEDLPEVMAWLHRRGVKGFLTVNVLVFTHALPAAAEASIPFMPVSAPRPAPSAHAPRPVQVPPAAAS